MPEIWIWLIIVTVPVAAAELLLLYRCRQALLSGVAPPVPEDAATQDTPLSAPDAGAVPPSWSLGIPSAEPAPTCAPEALLCFDPEGHCTAANLAGRQLLPRPEGGITLGDLLSGGLPAASSLLATLAAEGVIERDAAILPEPVAARVHIRALALRDRDNNFWGAALFIQPAAGDQHQRASAPSA